MKKLIVILGLVSFWVIFLMKPEHGQMLNIRGPLTRVLGEEWADKLLGTSEVVETPKLGLPQIPQGIKKTTDLATYSKKIKGNTEFDNLPTEKKRLFNYKFLEEIFLVTRKTEPKDEDLSNWLNTLEQGGSREGIYQALVLDEIYSGLENMDEKPSKALQDFSLNFSQKFLNQTFQAGSLSRLNLYSLKRIFTEKGLDLMDYYEAKDLDALYRWYAIFSADLAQKFAPILKSQIRKETSPEIHYEWAKGMPVQHVKSEFIIKMHIVMNGLQVSNQL